MVWILLPRLMVAGNGVIAIQKTQVVFVTDCERGTSFDRKSMPTGC
jgi:hypothetical protein